MISTRTLRDFTIETDWAGNAARRPTEWLVGRLLAVAVAWVVVILPLASTVAPH